MKRILIVRIGAMGDIIHALPGVASLRASFPDARITWVVEAKWAGLLEGGGLVDRLVFFHRQDRRTWGRTRRELQEERFDFAVDFQGALKSALIARAAASRIFGYAAGIVRERPACWLYSDRVETSAAHVVDMGLDLARAAGAMKRVEEFSLPNGSPEGPLPDHPFVLCSPMAGWTSKQWPVEYFAQLARDVEKKLGMVLVVNGAPGGVPEIAGAWRHESGIAGLIDASRRAALVVGVDSGPLHLAAGLGKAGVAIFGPTDPARNGPRGGNFTVLRQPGVETTHRRGTEIDASMRAVTPDKVFAALETHAPTLVP
jgi:heptosyltransferase-1